MPGQDTIPLKVGKGKDLSEILVSLFERRYLSLPNFENLSFEEDEGLENGVLLREIKEIGRIAERDEIRLVMPNILHACHNIGHSLTMILHGEGKKQQVFLGGRRIAGKAKGSTMAYIVGLESSFKTYYGGLKMGEMTKLDQITPLHELMIAAPCLTLITGIPSAKQLTGINNLQSLDRIARAAGNGKYVVMTVAEPVHPTDVDDILDKLRSLKSEIHALVKISVSDSTGENTSRSISTEIRDLEAENTGKMLTDVSAFLLGITLLTGGAAAPFLGILAGIGGAVGYEITEHEKMKPRTSEQYSEGFSKGHSESKELFNAHAEFCEKLIDEHIQRLQSAKSNGWWNMALYIIAENEYVLSNLEGAIRSLCSGSNSMLDPIRSIHIPSHTLRNSVIQGKILKMGERGTLGHPLGSLYENLATCVNSHELATLIHLPINEIPGIRFRKHAEYSLSLPENKEKKEEILLGTIFRDENALMDVGLTLESLNRHLFVTGMSGYGKTNTCMQILYEVYTKYKIPFLIIDPVKADYRNFLQVKEFSDTLRIFTIGPMSPLPLKLNPFELLPYKWIKNNNGFLAKHIDLLKAVFNASFPGMAGGPLSYVLEDAIIEIYKERGWNIYTSKNRFFNERSSEEGWYDVMPTLADLLPMVDKILERKNYASETSQGFRAALRSRISSMMNNNKGSVFNTKRSSKFTDLFDHPVLIEIKDLGDNDDKAFVMALLFVFLYEYSDSVRGENTTLRHLTLIEEAHRLLSSTGNNLSPEFGNPQAKAVGMFTEMIAEMRGYGEGFIIADQSPTALNQNTIKNTNIKIIHRLAYPDDRRLAGASVNLNNVQTDYLNNLDRGLAVVHEDRFEEAVLLKTINFKDTMLKAKLATYQWNHLFEKMSQNLKQNSKSYLFRHNGCIKCDNPCKYFYELPESKIEVAPEIGHFANYLVSGEIDEAFQSLKNWQHKQTESSNGLIYCKAINQLETWAQNWLTFRKDGIGKWDLGKDELIKGEFLKNLSTPVYAVLNAENLTDTLRSEISTDSFMDKYFRTPEKPLPCCENCSSQCRLKSLSMEILSDKKRKDMIVAKSKLPTNENADSLYPFKSETLVRDLRNCIIGHLNM